SARDAQLLDIPARVVAPDGGHHVLVPGQLQLHVGGVVWTAICRRSHERWRAGEGAGIPPWVEENLQVRALLRRKSRTVRVTRLRHDHQRHRARGDGEERGDEDDGGLQSPPAKVAHGFDQDGGHRDASSLRTRMTSEAARSGLSSRASSTIFPSTTLMTRAACRVANFASWVTSRIVWPSRLSSPRSSFTWSLLRVSSAPWGSTAS